MTRHDTSGPGCPGVSTGRQDTERAGYAPPEGCASGETDFLRGWFAAATSLERPYGESLFTPMTADDVRAAVAAMNAAVSNASCRMHAAWARHWAQVLKAEAAEVVRDAEARAFLCPRCGSVNGMWCTCAERDAAAEDSAAVTTDAAPKPRPPSPDSPETAALRVRVARLEEALRTLDRAADGFRDSFSGYIGGTYVAVTSLEYAQLAARALAGEDV